MVGGWDRVLVFGGAGPGGFFGGGVSAQGPAGFVFEPVVRLADRAEVVAVGAAAGGPGFVGAGVVDVAAGGRSVAGGEGADRVAGADVAGEFGAGLVAGVSQVQQGAGLAVVDEPAPLSVAASLRTSGAGNGP
jgi:hypothetical protein